MTVSEFGLFGYPGPEHEPLPEGGWWACHHPERAPDTGTTWFKRGCRPCLVALQAYMAQPGEPRLMTNRPEEPSEVLPVTVDYTRFVMERWFEPV